MKNADLWQGALPLNHDDDPGDPNNEPVARTLIRIEHCRSCDAPIWWGVTANGKACPYDVLKDDDGVPIIRDSHFKTCPNAKRWSKKAKP